TSNHSIWCAAYGNVWLAPCVIVTGEHDGYSPSRIGDARSRCGLAPHRCCTNKEEQTMRAGNQADRERYGHSALYSAFAAGLAIALLALAACGTSGNTSPYSVPVGWYDVSPPTADPIASYTISPDAPGLIVACIGAQTGHMSASPLGPATLWRTR